MARPSREHDEAARESTTIYGGAHYISARRSTESAGETVCELTQRLFFSTPDEIFSTPDATGFQAVSVGTVPGPADRAGRHHRSRLAIAAHGGCGRRDPVRQLCSRQPAVPERADGCLSGSAARRSGSVCGRSRAESRAVSCLRGPAQPEKAVSRFADPFHAIFADPLSRHSGTWLDTQRGLAVEIPRFA